MFIAPQMLDMVSLLAVPREHRETGQRSLRIAGTGFYVVLAEGGTDFYYLVTARHVAKVLSGGPWSMLVNRADGHAEELHMELRPDSKPRQWHFHPTELDRVDVAVLPGVLGSRYVATALGSTLFMERTDLLYERAHEKEAEDQFMSVAHGKPKPDSVRVFTTGDEVTFIGVFAPHHGTTRLHPIVRTGTLAMIPYEGELIPTKIGPMEVALVEARSVGGLSGSPVFMDTATRYGKITRLLGLIHGHWTLPPEHRNTFGNSRLIMDQAPEIDTPDDRDNWGVAAVVPAWKIREVLYQPELVQMRADLLAKGGAGNDKPD